MRVLVTGGAGFIGSHVVDRLLEGGHEPRLFDLVRSPYHAETVESHLGDVVDPLAVRVALRGCDAVVHLAAVADVNVVVAEPTRACLVNAGGTQVLLEAAREEGVGRFVYASTVWVYGNATGHGPVTEDSPVELPSHLYTATKLAGEMYCRSYHVLYGLEQTILRFGIPFGPRSRQAAVVAAFVALARAGKALTIAGDGRQTRQFVYVEDLAAGIVAALAPCAAGQIYNLVADEQVSVREIAELIRERVAEVPIIHIPERPADLRIGYISSVRAATELGWRSETTFADGVGRYLDWLSVTNGAPIRPPAATINRSAATVFRHESGEP